MFVYAAAVGARRALAESGAPAASGSYAKKELFWVALCCLAAGAAAQVLLAACALRQAPGQGLAQALEHFFYYNIDARHYIEIAQLGYLPPGTGPEEQHLMIVFFPLFPLLLRLLNPTGAMPWYFAAMFVQLPLFCWAGTAVYVLVSRSYGRSAARWTLAFLLASPGAIFFFTPMTESLFLALSASFFLALEKGRPAAAGWLGLLAALCRSPGALLAGAAAAWYILCWRREKSAPRPAALWPVAAPALGLGMYLLLNWRVYGNWFQFAVYQKEHWHQGAGFFTDTVRYHLDYFASWWAGGNRAGALFISLAAVCTILCSLALLTLTAKKLAVHHLAYGLAYLAFTMGATWLLSAPRYAEGLFLLPAALALTARRRGTRWLVLAVLAVLGAVYTAEFIRHGPIY